MTNKTQIQTKKISFVLALSVITYTAIDTYLFTFHDIDTMKITTPVILGLVVIILLCGLLQQFFYTWLTNNQIQFSFSRHPSHLHETQDDAECIYVNDTQPEQEYSLC